LVLCWKGQIALLQGERAQALRCLDEINVAIQVVPVHPTSRLARAVTELEDGCKS